MAVATLGAFLVIAGVLGLVSLYLGAVTQAMSGVQRTSSLPDYDGRPTPQENQGSRAMRYLVLVTDEHGGLASAFVVQLTGARDGMQLIGLPANLLVADAKGRDTALATEFEHGVGSAVRAVEGLIGVRVDHMVQVRLQSFTRIIDVLGGVTVGNRTETAAEGWHFDAGELRLTGPEAEVYVTSPKYTMSKLERTQAVFVEIVRGMASGDALTNPAKVEAIGDVLNAGVTVDAALTAGEIRRMAIDMHLSPDLVTGTPLPLAGISELHGSQVIVPDPDRVRLLATAMQNDAVDAWAAAQTAPWQQLNDLPPR